MLRRSVLRASQRATAPLPLPRRMPFVSVSQHPTSAFSIPIGTRRPELPAPSPSCRPTARWYSDTAATENQQRAAAAEPSAQPSAAQPQQPPPSSTSAQAPSGQQQQQQQQQAASSAESTEAQTQLEKKEREVIDLKDRLLRSIADFRNLQTQTKREVALARDFALQRFARDLIESVDNLDRALGTVPPEKLQPAASTAPASASTPASPEQQQQQQQQQPQEPNADLVALHDGLRMTERIMMETLKKHGLERFDPSASSDAAPTMFDPNVHEAVFHLAQPDRQDGSVFYTQQKGYMLNGRVLRAAKVGVVKNS